MLQRAEVEQEISKCLYYNSPQTGWQRVAGWADAEGKGAHRVIHWRWRERWKQEWVRCKLEMLVVPYSEAKDASGNEGHKRRGSGVGGRDVL